MNTTLDRDTLKGTDDKAHNVQPPLYAIVAHADTSSLSVMLANSIAHVIYAHVGLTADESVSIARKVLRQGKALVKAGLTKEIAETIMVDVNSCAMMGNDKFDFKLEKA